jgi:transcriptional regulator with XRE-family HTH domain
MGQRRLTVARYEEIKRRLAEGRGLREIARALGCSRNTVREIRDGLINSPAETAERLEPAWMLQLNWKQVIDDLAMGHPLKLIWEEQAQTLTTYPNFWKQFYRKFPEYRLPEGTTAREFSAGERVEVDWAGDPIPWIDLKTGEIHNTWLFVSGLGFSQYAFARATADMKSANWLSCHRRMYEYYGGVPAVTVPDCLKQGVLKCHIYDPDINPGYAQMAQHYSTSVVPARPKHPQDKAIVEGLVKLLSRYIRFRFRNHRFSSIIEINRGVAECLENINNRKHTRFRVSRRERFEQVERAALRPLPSTPYEEAEWREPRLHPDCFIAVDGAYYSAPHIYRGKKLDVKLTENQVEIYLDLKLLAIHTRDRRRGGYRTKIKDHFPPNSVAYYEATPQNLLAQAGHIDESLHRLAEHLFQIDVFAHIRRVQGLLRVCAAEIKESGREAGIAHIRSAIATMRQMDNMRVSFCKQLLVQARRQKIKPDAQREIVRKPGNPMLRHVAKEHGDEDSGSVELQGRLPL